MCVPTLRYRFGIQFLEPQYNGHILNRKHTHKMTCWFGAEAYHKTM
jgi:hypothetical protein